MSRPHDGPKMSSQPFFWRPEAHQGRAYPTARSPEETECDRRRLDHEEAARLLMRATIEQKIDRLNRQDRERFERRRREKRLPCQRRASRS